MRNVLEEQRNLVARGHVPLSDAGEKRVQVHISRPRGFRGM